jgi:hypothetical protein
VTGHAPDLAHSFVCAVTVLTQPAPPGAPSDQTAGTKSNVAALPPVTPCTAISSLEL